MARFSDDEATFSYDQTDFSGGVASVPDARLIAEKEVAYMQNGYPARSGRIAKRSGIGELSGISVAGNVRAIRRIQAEAVDLSALLIWHGTTLTYIDTAGDPHELDTALANDDAPIAHEEWLGECYYSDGTNGLKKAFLALEDTAATATVQMTAHSFSGWGIQMIPVTITAVTTGTGGNAYTFEMSYSASATPVIVTLTGTDITCVFGDALGVSLADLTAALIAACSSVVTFTFGSYDDSRYTTIGWSSLNTAGATPLYGGAAEGDVSLAVVAASMNFSYLAKRTASERLFGIDADDPTNLRWCEAYAPGSWLATSLASPGGRFLAAGEVGDSFIAVTDDAIYRIDGSDPATWKMTAIASEGLGCRAAASFTVIEKTAVWWSARGLAYYDGTTPKTLSDLVFDPKDETRCLLPADTNLWPTVYCFSTGTHLYVCWLPASGTAAMVYDFRMQAWGGPYLWTDVLYCGCASLRAEGESARPHFGGASKVFREDPDLHTDGASAITMLVKSRDLDGARPLRDKIYTEVRAELESTATGAVTLGMMFEDEATARTKATVTAALAAGANWLRKRLENNRAHRGAIWVTHSADDGCELAAFGCDLFFPRPR